jgi:hypothetical protein
MARLAKAPPAIANRKSLDSHFKLATTKWFSIFKEIR